MREALKLRSLSGKILPHFEDLCVSPLFRSLSSLPIIAWNTSASYESFVRQPPVITHYPEAAQRAVTTL